MVSSRLVLILICIAALCISPGLSDKNKGLFSGDILDVGLEAFVADIPDSPAFITEKEEAVEENPQDIQSWVDIGKAQLKAENWESAGEAFTQVLELDPQNKDGWEGRFQVLLGE